MEAINEEIFRAYDIRGTYPKTINEQVAFTIGRSYGSYLQEKYNKNTCIVSHDNRLSSEALTQNLIKGLVSSGLNIISLGYTTTPMNYYARYINQMPGIMVTATAFTKSVVIKTNKATIATYFITLSIHCNQ